jgi:ribosomal subunit interface protein
MDILIQADGVVLTESLKAAVDEKIGRIELHAPRTLRARVRLRKVSAHPSPRQYLVRVLCELPGRDLSVEEPAADVLTALDSVAEKIERRLRRRKTERLARRTRRPRTAQKETL